MKIYRLWEERLRVTTKEEHEETINVISFRAELDMVGTQEETEWMAQKISEKKSGIFYVQREFRGARVMRLGPVVVPLQEEDQDVEGEPNYPTFSAGYRNGKKEFPIIGKVRNVSQD